ncbi:MAG TPA: Mini-ribonuclease 3 [Firmicutes bacterium]|nr:Mini-ribonuclease 3 [Bacillota bacterium]
MDYRHISPLLLAYVGDAVFDLYVRAKLVRSLRLPVQDVHKKATQYVRAAGQDAALHLLESQLTETEADIVRRGRNTKSRVPKNAGPAVYRRATGFEALLGWLYLTGQKARLEELLAQLTIGEEGKQ